MLKDIRTPNDIKQLDYKQLDALAREIRETIIDTVSRNGGHLSSNLGAVELTIAVDRVLDYPKDRVIFDVGHQAYAHKLLTGRYARFASLRKSGGIAGFPSMDELPEDSFTSGHASTSVSAALGLCRARDLRGGKETIVAVIGDGALTGGMSYEALNDAGDSGTDIIVVINDNEMSISRNVGALSMHLTRMRQSRVYRGFKVRLRNFLGHVPLIGKPIYHVVETVHDMIKAMFIRRNIFEDMGFKYIGTVDGHNIKKLVRALNLAREAGGPVIIHAVTRKGRGYAPAEKEPDRFHGPAPFDVSTGKSLGVPDKNSGAYAADIVAEMAANDDRICAITAAMPGGTGFARFGKEHPKRFFDVGIAEEHAVTMAGGLAAAGLKPYVAIYSTFLQRAFDQIVNDVCLNSLPVTFLLDRAGLVGADGATHNGVLDLSYLRCIPGMTVAAPRDIRYLEKLLRWSRDFNAPLAIRYPRDAVDLGAGMSNDEPVVPGKWEVLMDGSDVAIFACGSMVQTALLVSMELHGLGISAAVIDAMFIKPMDEAIISRYASAAKLIVTLEESDLIGGFGEGVTAAVNGKTEVMRFGVPDRYIRHAARAEQLTRCGLDPASVAAAVKKYFNK